MDDALQFDKSDKSDCTETLGMKYDNCHKCHITMVFPPKLIFEGTCKWFWLFVQYRFQAYIGCKTRDCN